MEKWNTVLLLFFVFPGKITAEKIISVFLGKMRSGVSL